MEKQKTKRKLTIKEQLDDLESKGISFELTNRKDAREFLTYNTYYYKLKAYERVFDVYNSGQNAGKYINVDFAYLVELSSLDMHFRRLILNLCLDIEHFLKTRFVNDVLLNNEEDGFRFVNKYISDYNEELGILKKSKEGEEEDSALGRMIQKHRENPENTPIWKFVELLSFGEFIKFYKEYYNEYPASYASTNYYGDYLENIRFLRNAAAHNTCLLNNLKVKYKKFKKNKQFMNALSGIPGGELSSDYKTRLENRIVHDFSIALIVYFELLNYKPNKESREKKLAEVERFLDTTTRHKEYFMKNNVLVADYTYLRSLQGYLQKISSKSILFSKKRKLC